MNAEGHTISFNAGTVHPGSSGSFTFTAQARNSSTGDSQGIVSAFADIYEDDANAANNTDQLLLNFYNKPPEGFLGYHQIYARLEIKKERLGIGIALPGQNVPYKITVENKGAGNAYMVRVSDELRKGDAVVSTQGWELDTVLPGEKVVIEYSVAFAPNTPAGLYTNYALAKWYDEVGNYVDHSGHSSAEIAVALAPSGSSFAESVETGGSPLPAQEFMLSRADGEGGGVSGYMEDILLKNNEEALAMGSTVSAGANLESGNASFDSEKEILTDAQVVYITDVRPLDKELHDELNHGFNPWDPQNLLAHISVSSAGYSIIWALLASFVVYMVTRRRIA